MTRSWAKPRVQREPGLSHTKGCVVPGAEGQARAADQPHGAVQHFTRRAAAWGRRAVPRMWVGGRGMLSLREQTQIRSGWPNTGSA